MPKDRTEDFAITVITDDHLPGIVSPRDVIDCAREFDAKRRCHACGRA